MKAIAYWILALIVIMYLSFYFNGDYFILRCILTTPFTYLAVKETFKK